MAVERIKYTINIFFAPYNPCFEAGRNFLNHIVTFSLRLIYTLKETIETYLRCVYR